MGVEKAAKGSIATPQIKQPGRLLDSKNPEQCQIDIALGIGGSRAMPAIYVNSGGTDRCRFFNHYFRMH
jgi:hypothetical protein